MKREPTIHVKESDLLWGLQQLGPCSPKLVREVLEVVKARSITRFGWVKNKKETTKAERLTQSSRIDTDVFAQLLTLVRKRAKHRGVQTIKPNSRDWGMLKDITSSANEFQLEFGLGKKEAYTRYIEIALSKMNKFTLNKLPSMSEAIFLQYQSEVELKEDKNPEKTLKGFEYYRQRIMDSTGVPIEYQRNPEKYVFFYRARLIAEKYQVPFVEYLKAQFEAFVWQDRYPDPAQLIGDKAIERLGRYSAKNNIRAEKKTKKVGLKNVLKIK